MLYQIIDGTVSLGGETVLSHFNFEIKQNDKIALVGRNGSGKTTLLRLISNQLEPDRDDKRLQQAINMSRKTSIGYLEQVNTTDDEMTVEQLILESCPVNDAYSKERYLYEMEYDRLFTGFGLSKED